MITRLDTSITSDSSTWTIFANATFKICRFLGLILDTLRQPLKRQYQEVGLLKGPHIWEEST
jgi:hypothetical protein